MKEWWKYQTKRRQNHEANLLMSMFSNVSLTGRAAGGGRVDNNATSTCLEPDCEHQTNT